LNSAVPSVVQEGRRCYEEHESTHRSLVQQGDPLMRWIVGIGVLVLAAIIVLLVVMQIGSETTPFKPVAEPPIKKEQKNEGLGVPQPPRQ